MHIPSFTLHSFVLFSLKRIERSAHVIEKFNLLLNEHAKHNLMRRLFNFQYLQIYFHGRRSSLVLCSLWRVVMLEGILISR